MPGRGASIRDTDVVILCGGAGRRLGSAACGLPKPMADINGRPFLTILMDYAAGFGFRRFILCAGFRGEAIRRHYSGPGERPVLVSQEESPLGTAGAIKNAEHLIESGSFLVMNGDSFCAVDLKDMAAFHAAKEARATIAVAGMPETDGAQDYGLIRLGAGSEVVGFSEKAPAPEAAPFVSAGVYLFEKEVLGAIPPGREMSLEYELFPALITGGVYGYVTGGKLLDIGTPERLEAARRYFPSFPRESSG